jgi:hypothetical protein
METLPEDIFHHITLPLGTRFRLGRVSRTLREKICLQAVATEDDCVEVVGTRRTHVLI